MNLHVCGCNSSEKEGRVPWFEDRVVVQSTLHYSQLQEEIDESKASERLIN